MDGTNEAESLISFSSCCKLTFCCWTESGQWKASSKTLGFTALQIRSSKKNICLTRWVSSRNSRSTFWGWFLVKVKGFRQFLGASTCVKFKVKGSQVFAFSIFFMFYLWRLSKLIPGAHLFWRLMPDPHFSSFFFSGRGLIGLLLLLCWYCCCCCCCCYYGCCCGCSGLCQLECVYVFVCLFVFLSFRRWFFVTYKSWLFGKCCAFWTFGKINLPGFAVAIFGFLFANVSLYLIIVCLVDLFCLVLTCLLSYHCLFVCLFVRCLALFCLIFSVEVNFGAIESHLMTVFVFAPYIFGRFSVRWGPKGDNSPKAVFYSCLSERERAKRAERAERAERASPTLSTERQTFGSDIFLLVSLLKCDSCWPWNSKHVCPWSQLSMWQMKEELQPPGSFGTFAMGPVQFSWPCGATETWFTRVFGVFCSSKTT